MKCKNCEKETENNNIYCSYKCRNNYVNSNLRDYSKNNEGQKKYYQEKKLMDIKEYDKNPKFCKSCNSKFTYDEKHKTYCNISCSNKKRIGKKHNMSKSGKLALQESMKRLKKYRGITDEKIKEQKKEYYSNIKRCPNCEKMLSYKKRNRIYCDINCKRELENKNKSEMMKYKSKTKFNFSLNDFPDEFEFNLIQQYGWYSPSNSKTPNLGGVSRDHMISVVDGFKKGINPELLSHPANCKLMIHSKNIGKNSNSSITLEELNERINIWDSKYKVNKKCISRLIGD